MSDFAQLVKELGSGDVSIRENAAETLGRTGDPKAREPLIQALNDKNRFVRQAAIRGLGRTGDSGTIQLLTNMLSTEKDEFVKDTLNKAIETLKANPAASK